MEVEQNQREVPTQILETVEPRCEHFLTCESPSRRAYTWACWGHVTDDDRLMMCACFNRFLNPEQKPEYMSERDWISVLKRKIRANLEAHKTNRGKDR